MPRDIYPSMRYRDARAAIDWLERAFGFTRHAVHEGPDGTVVHAELRYGDGLVMLGAWRGEDDHRRPGQGWAYVAVDNLDDHLRQAREASAEIVDGPQHEEYGSFYGPAIPRATCGASARTGRRCSDRLRTRRSCHSTTRSRRVVGNSRYPRVNAHFAGGRPPNGRKLALLDRRSTRW